MVLVVLVAASPVQAGWLGFRNETTQPIIVRRASVVKNKVHLGKPVVLYPGEISWDSVARSGAKRIIVYDARKRPVLQTNITCGKDDQFFGIRLVRPAQLRLVPLRLPANKKHHSSH
jgi:hypothetical protein